MTKIDKGGSPNFKDVADQVFGTLLTITTILSGVYASIAFGWFGQVMITPHEGRPVTSEMLAAAIVGIFLGVVFILPLVFILLSWALEKFRNSSAWATAAWSGLIYCLAQDFIGIIALFSFSLIAAGAFDGTTLIVAGAFVILIPPIFSIWIGHIIGVKYSQLDETPKKREKTSSDTSFGYGVLDSCDSNFLGGFPLLSGGVYVGLKTDPSVSCPNHGKSHNRIRGGFWYVL